MFKFIVKNKHFYFPLILLLILGAVYFALFYSKGDWVLWLCDNYNAFIYEVFTYITLLGEPQIVLPVVIVLFLYNVGSGAMVLSSWISASLITISLKNILKFHRPPFYYKDQFIACAGDLDFIYNLSTPSGHTTAAFAFFASLAILSKNKGLQLFFLLLALLTGLSRMVLFVHFYYDVYLGAFIGAFTALFVFWLFLQKNAFNFKEWKNKSILQRRI